MSSNIGSGIFYSACVLVGFAYWGEPSMWEAIVNYLNSAGCAQ